MYIYTSKDNYYIWSLVCLSSWIYLSCVIMDYLWLGIVWFVAIVVVFGLLRYGVQYLLKFILAHYIIASIIFALSYWFTLLLTSFGADPIGSFLWIDTWFWLSLVQSIQLFFVLGLYIGLVILVMHASTFSLYVPSVRIWKYLLYIFLLPLALSSIGLVSAIVYYYFGFIQEVDFLVRLITFGPINQLIQHIPLWVWLHGFLTLFIVLEVQRDRQRFFRKKQSVEDIENDLMIDDTLS